MDNFLAALNSSNYDKESFKQLLDFQKVKNWTLHDEFMAI